MSESSSPTDFVDEMLRGAAEELGASALTFRSPAIISYKIFWKREQLHQQIGKTDVQGKTQDILTKVYKDT